MTRRKTEVALIGDIQPDQIYRTTLSSTVFGYGPQATRDKIRNGELPRPFPLSPTSRFEAWTGRQIIEHRAQMHALAAEKAKAIADKSDRCRTEFTLDEHDRRTVAAGRASGK
jgi:hypothetical protein